MTTVLARRNQFHQERLGSNLTPDNLVFRGTLNGLSKQLQQSGMSAHDALNGAYGRVYQNLQIQASTLSYIDTFWLLTVAAATMFCMTFVLKKNDPRGGEKVVPHLNPGGVLGCEHGTLSGSTLDAHGMLAQWRLRASRWRRSAEAGCGRAVCADGRAAGRGPRPAWSRKAMAGCRESRPGPFVPPGGAPRGMTPS